MGKPAEDQICAIGSEPRSDLPLFARISPLAVHAPSLFRSLALNDRRRYLRTQHNLGDLQVEFSGPELGATELRVMQGLLSLSRPPSTVTVSGEDTLERIASLLALSVRVDTTFVALAEAIGMQGGSAPARIRKAVKLLHGVSIEVASGPRAFVMEHLIKRLEGRKGGSVHVELSPALALAVLGSPGDYLRVDMDEVRRLHSDPARILHHRLHWVNAGDARTVRIDTLVGYVYPEPVEGATLRKRRKRVRDALDEIRNLLGWSISFPRADLVEVGRPSVHLP